jgi:purine nucleosidase
VLVHLDTDLGSNPDDAAALVALLGQEDVELVGVTTNLEIAGRRAGCAHHFLRLARREDVPVAAGSPPPGELPERYEPTWGDTRYWPDPVEPAPGPVGAALDQLEAAIAAGAKICTIGALTNLARVEQRRPGRLRGARVVTLGGCVDPFADDLPAWGPERDVNLQVDVPAAEVALGAGAEVTLVQLPAAVRAQLRTPDLDRLERVGVLGRLLARQVLAHRDRVGNRALAAAHPGLADDLVAVLWDPVAAAVASGWVGAEIARLRLRVVVDADGVLRTVADPAGAEVDVVEHIDGDAVIRWWLSSVEAAHARAGG